MKESIITPLSIRSVINAMKHDGICYQCH